MIVLEYVLIGGIVTAILFFLSALYFFVCFFLIDRKIEELSYRRVKNKQQKKKLIKRMIQLKRTRKIKLIVSILFLLCSVSLSVASTYTIYFKSRDINLEDSELVTKGYYLLRDFEEQLLLPEKNDETKQMSRYLAATMASYGTKRASEDNSLEGQLALNRYYHLLTQFGKNASTQMTMFYRDKNIAEDFLIDIEKVKEYEQRVFDYYQLKESAFKED